MQVAAGMTTTPAELAKSMDCRSIWLRGREGYSMGGQAMPRDVVIENPVTSPSAPIGSVSRCWRDWWKPSI